MSVVDSLVHGLHVLCTGGTIARLYPQLATTDKALWVYYNSRALLVISGLL